MTNDENKFMQDVINQASNKVELLQKTVIEKAVEIERLKDENARLKEKLKQVLLSIDTVKEMNAMVNIHEQIKQAKIDVLNELIDKMFEREYMGVKYKERIFYESEINDMIAEVQNGEDKSFPH